MLILDEKNFKTTNWSGGKTTELFISPRDSSFADRNFDFRLSTATVEIETSDFTPFEGTQRHLMILSGEMHLEHEGHHSIQLKKGEQDRFFGDWQTRSTGTCVDFNLMLRNGEGSLESIFLEKGESTTLSTTNDFLALYLVEGACEIGSGILQSNQLIIVNDQTEIIAKEDAFLVRVEVKP